MLLTVAALCMRYNSYMYITDRNKCERAEWSEFYGSTVNPNEHPARRTLMWLLPLALVVVGLFLVAIVSGNIKGSSVFVAGALLLAFLGAPGKRS